LCHELPSDHGFTSICLINEEKTYVAFGLEDGSIEIYKHVETLG